MSQLKILQTLWGMEKLKNQRLECSLYEKRLKIKDVGFAGSTEHFFDKHKTAAPSLQQAVFIREAFAFQHSDRRFPAL